MKRIRSVYSFFCSGDIFCRHLTAAQSVTAPVIWGVPGSHRSGMPACSYPSVWTKFIAPPPLTGDCHAFCKTFQRASTPIPVSAIILCHEKTSASQWISLIETGPWRTIWLASTQKSLSDPIISLTFSRGWSAPVTLLAYWKLTTLTVSSSLFLRSARSRQ